MKHRITEIRIESGWMYKWALMVLLVILTVFMGLTVAGIRYLVDNIPRIEDLGVK